MEIVVLLITRNTEIPFILESEPGQFGTAEDNQSTIEIVMMEADGDSLDADDCKEIGRGSIELPAGVQRRSEVTSDEEFLRRLTIGTIGSVPSPEELRSFLADTNPQKRSKKIDELLTP